MHRTLRLQSMLLVLFAAQGVWSSSVVAQVSVDPETTAPDPEEGKTRPKFLVLPVPFSNPSDGTGIGAGGVVFYNPNGGEHQWTSGVGGIWTSRGSKGIALFHTMYSANDQYRLNANASWFDRNDKYYGIGADDGDRNEQLGLDARQFKLKVRALGQVTKSTFLGFQYMLLLNDATADEEGESVVTPPPQDELDSTMSAIGPVAVYDTRDSHDEPSRGVNLIATWLFGMKAIGDSFSHNTFSFLANGYRPLGENTVLAGRGSLCASGGDVAYYALCRYGASNNLRGYPSDRYRDRASWAAQSEVRQQFNSRWGGVAFFGVGGIAPSAGDVLSESNFLPAGGVGVRYRLFRKNDVRARLDLAFGKDANGVYLSFGEAY